MRAVPKLQKLHDELGDQGLVLIGMHSTRGGDAMADFVERAKITYPVAVDVESRTADAYLVDGRPDYHIIDRAGNVRVADCANGGVEAVVRALLAEPNPFAMPEVLREASEKARAKDKRIVGLLGSAEARERVRGAWRADRETSKFVFNEYEAVEVGPEDAEGLMTSALFGVAPPPGEVARVVVFDAEGRRLAARDLAPEDGGGLVFLREHAVPQKDANALLAAALEQATRENKRVLVHLGAPW